MTGAAQGYLSLAISTDEGMGPADDCYICSATTSGGSTIVFSSAYLTGESPPTILNPITTNVQSSVTNGIMTCTFTRPISVSKTVSGNNVTWDVSKQSFNVLFAEGNVTVGGGTTYHSVRKHTHGAFNLLKPKDRLLMESILLPSRYSLPFCCSPAPPRVDK
uniref:DOMON domain-containing protein n=1 Tax=Ciona savignyi TaxID=51511 RepID=H2YRA7_CIOSA